MPFLYLTTWGTVADPSAPGGTKAVPHGVTDATQPGWAVLDLPIPGTGRRCFVVVPNRNDAAIGGTLLGTWPDGLDTALTTAQRTAIGTALGITVDSTTPRALFVEVLVTKAAQITVPPVWAPAFAKREIWLANVLVWREP